ncbi:GumC family protein [Desulfonatronovibrio magnus]|uniref:GumC family protein n=1 Tax=Desulfonatronovibrio magnus TaxID=698827 RepID=UPI000698D2F7|nr:Wzz/FepE/Etk N-terminal domain-containing protein [Desulfonatronovibrio magnus]
MDTNTNDLIYLQGVLKRRKLHFLVPFVIIIFIAAGAAVMLPSIYSSRATILIETQNIPEEMVRSTVTGYVEERLQSLSQIVLSRVNLEDIITRLNLYPELREKESMEQLVVRMRNNIKVTPIQAQVANPRMGRTITATIAFNIAYQDKDPQQASRVAGALTSLYLEQNLRAREEKAAGAVNFFRQQLSEQRKEIDAREEDIARFKEMHILSLPELLQFNMQMLERTKNEIDARQKDVQSSMNRLIYLQGQMASIEPVRFRSGPNGRSASLEDELRFLNNQYLSLKAVKTENHPDVIRLKNQINSLDQEALQRHHIRDLVVSLEEKQNELTLLQQRYSENHPDVIRLSREIGNLNSLLADKNTSWSILRDIDNLEQENPVYINLRTQIASTRLEIDSNQGKIRELERHFADYQQRIENSPAIEQQFKLLQRDYQSVQQAYQETMSRMQAALEALELEEGQLAEKLTVIDPPQASKVPVKPNRKAIIMLGFVLASGLGVGSTAMAEYFDSTIRDTGNLARVTGQPVLGSIPPLLSKRDIIINWLSRLAWLVLVLSMCGLALGMVHYFYQPLDNIWAKLLGLILQITAQPPWIEGITP